MENISTHITYDQAVHSDTANAKHISNVPDDAQLTNMKILATHVYEVLYIHFGGPIVINSFFRCQELNTAVGGASSSQHMALNGAAIDLNGDTTPGDITNDSLFEYIKDYMDFDQLIREHRKKDGTGGWVHVSYKASGNRKQILYL